MSLIRPVHNRQERRTTRSQGAIHCLHGAEDVLDLLEPLYLWTSSAVHVTSGQTSLVLLTVSLCIYCLFRRWRRSAAENGLCWNIVPLMVEKNISRSARFLTMPTVVEYFGIIHCGAFASLSVIYGALDSILFIALCSHENSSSPPHSILGNHIPVCDNDRKLYHGRLTLVLEAKLGSSNVICALRQLPI